MNACPMLVVGAGNTSAQVLQRLNALLRAFRSPINHITALVLQENSSFIELHAPRASIPALSQNPFLLWMVKIRAEDNLDRVRGSGVQVGSPAGYSLVQVLLVVDSGQLDAIWSTLPLLEEAAVSLQETVPPRLHLLVLHPQVDDLPMQSLGSLRDSIQTQLLPLCSVWTLSPARSDGSFLSYEEFITVVSYLLFAALQPADRNEQHWLFRKPHRGSDNEWTVLGCGLVVLPLPEIEEALVNRLWSDAYSELFSESDATPELPNDLPLDETSWWSRLLQAVPEIVRAGTDLTLSLRQEAPHAEGEPQQWVRQLEEWDTRWRQETLPRSEQAMQRVADELLKVFHAYLQSYIRENMLVCRGALPLLSTLLNKVAHSLEQWTVSKVQVEEVSPSSVQATRALFERSVERLPDRGKVFTLSALLVLASWAVLQGVLWFYAAHLGSRLWWAVAAAALLPPLVIGLIAYAFYRQRKQQLLQHWHLLVSEIRAQHVQLLRQSAVRVLQRTLEQLQGMVRQEQEQLQLLQQQIQTQVAVCKQAAEALHLVLPPPLRSVVSYWKHIQSVAQELWGHRSLSAVLRKGMEEIGIASLLDLTHRVRELSEYLRRRLLDDWMRPEHRQITYYLRQRFHREEDFQEWVQDQMEKATQEAHALLWRCERPVHEEWKLLVRELPLMNGARARTWHSGETLVVTNVFGKICGAPLGS